MELRKSGFTLAEFMISITAMLIVMAAALPITFNKVKQDQKFVRNDGELYYNCTQTSLEKEFTLNSDSRREFVEILLVGGGAGGSNGKGGGAGEGKVVYYPALTGTFKIVLGAGGTSGKDGGNTALYKKLSNENWELIEFARGGIASNDLNNSSEGEDPAFAGEIIKNGIAEKSQCGKGGTGSGSGKAGEARISW